MTGRKEPNGRPTRGVTVSDVARRAGVSTASVSRALNAPHSLRPHLRARIDEAVRELGYIPSGAARALVTRHTRAVGAVVPTLDNAIFATGISALQRRLAESGYTLLIAAAEYDLDQELDEVRTLLGYGVEGLMLIGAAHHPEVYDLLARNAVAYVCCWMFDAESPHPCIGFDNRATARGLAQSLLALGHRDIGVIAGVTHNNDRAASRLAGIRDALSGHGLSLPPHRVTEAPYDIGAGRAALRTLLVAAAEPPTAVFCGNDVLATGAVLECQARGIDVPRGLSLVGFDDLPIAAHLQPPLSTVRVPSAAMGRRAGDYLLARLRGRQVAPHVHVEADFISRETCAPPQPR